MIKPGAFTLTEILIVIVLLGLMAVVAVPALPHPPPTTPAVAAADTVASLLEGVRRRAIERGTTIDVLLDSATGHYWVRPRRGDTATEGILTLPPDVTIGAPPRARFTFDPTGTASGDRITIFDGRGGAAPISVDTWTGEVEHGQAR
jgi:Tfp pilus assembly protein FimT